MTPIIDINSPASIEHLSIDQRLVINRIQDSLLSIAHSLIVIADPDSPETVTDPFDLLTFSKDDARKSIQQNFAKPVQQHGHDMPVQVTDKLDGRKVLLSLHVRVIEGAEPPTIFQIEVR